jgi:hypothetical protein
VTVHDVLVLFCAGPPDPEAVMELAAGDPNTPKYAKVVFNNNVTGTLLISQVCESCRR